MSTRPDDNTISRLREAERQRLFMLPQFPNNPPDDEKGVLLSDRIKHYCKEYKLITPFDETRLRPAGYDLRVGSYYSIGGDTKALNEGMRLEIGPYQVAIIETYETLNMPEFLIGRWNVRVARAYQGLLWVGGAQVDPGFRGHLCCPIYNLSTDPVPLGYGDDLAMIDFVTTTPYQEGKCLRFDWAKRKKLVFPEYTPLNSGIEARVEDFSKKIEDNKDTTQKALASANASSERSFREIGTRIDYFVTLVFTVVAVLFAGLGIVATKGSDEPSFVSSPVWIAAVALYFALRAYDRSHWRDAQPHKWYTRLAPGILELVIAGIVVLASVLFHFSHAQRSAKELQHASGQASKAINDLAQEKQHFETAIRDLRQQSDAKLDNLQQQVNRVQQGQAKKR
jgi:deoxycytidine triphosphate deaminase